MHIPNVLLACSIALGATARAQAAEARLIDGGEGTPAWEDGRLGVAGVVKGIAAATDPVRAGSHSIEITLDSLDGAQDSATASWPRQAGVQTNTIPAQCVDMSKAKAVRISLFAQPDSASGPGLLQARLYLKTGTDWLWHTTEALDGNTAFTDLYPGSWIELESPVENFYSAQTVRGIIHPEMLRSVGVQFFTWGGAWSGKVYLDQVELVDSLPETAALRAEDRGGNPGWSAAAGPWFDAQGRHIGARPRPAEGRGRPGAGAYRFGILGR